MKSVPNCPYYSIMKASEKTYNTPLVAEKDICIVVPTFNNERTISVVIDQLLRFSYTIIVVADGCTDHTIGLLMSYADSILPIIYKRNRGKGYALKCGLLRAQEMGFRYAITIDADGQHYTEDIPLFVEEIQKHPDSLVIGSRILQNENMSKNSTFANHFSNFWFYIQTGKPLPDTQTGFRLYPLRELKCLNLLTNKYEAELELLVFSCWHGIELRPISIQVYYPPREERVSHFRPFIDFMRIFLLNTFLCLAAIVYGLPLRIYHSIRRGRR